MGSDLVPYFVERVALETEIQRLRALHTLEEVESFGLDGGFCPEVKTAARPDPPLHRWESCRLLTEALSMRYQLLSGTWIEGSVEKLAQTAESLFMLLGAFSCGMCGVEPYNEYGFRRCTIIHADSARRLHLRFDESNPELLRPLFAEHCREKPSWGSYRWLTSYDSLLDYAKALDALLAQAAATDRTLYVWVSY